MCTACLGPPERSTCIFAARSLPEIGPLSIGHPSQLDISQFIPKESIGNTDILESSMELRHLRYFIAAAENGSVSAASRALHISQSAISEQLSDLESEIEIPLFTRTSRKATLTPAGELFLTEARRIISN